ncbi:MAG: cyclic nucleotide-binding domain-containing protein [candidate division WOR-3 bacterium]
MEKTRHFKAGEVIISEGDIPKEMFLIKKGRVRIKKKGKWITDLKTGDFLGEMGALDRHPRSATAIAVEDTILSVIEVEELEKKLQRDPIIYHLVKSLIKRLRETNRKLYSEDRNETGG